MFICGVGLYVGCGLVAVVLLAISVWLMLLLVLAVLQMSCSS
jgi:hypothetical protein